MSNQSELTTVKSFVQSPFGHSPLSSPPLMKLKKIWSSRNFEVNLDYFYLNFTKI